LFVKNTGGVEWFNPSFLIEDLNRLNTAKSSSPQDCPEDCLTKVLRTVLRICYSEEERLKGLRRSASTGG
jgi:hypothetical protein